jgi:hypothetical protein
VRGQEEPEPAAGGGGAGGGGGGRGNQLPLCPGTVLPSTSECIRED